MQVETAWEDYRRGLMSFWDAFARQPELASTDDRRTTHERAECWKANVNKVTANELRTALDDLLAAVLKAHPDPLHAAYPPIARAITIRERVQQNGVEGNEMTYLRAQLAAAEQVVEAARVLNNEIQRREADARGPDRHRRDAELQCDGDRVSALDTAIRAYDAIKTNPSPIRNRDETEEAV